MELHVPSSPFGPRPLSLAAVNGQRVAKNCAAEASVDKWRVFRAVCEAKTQLGATDRSLVVLSALLTFYPSNELVGEGALVFPSNVQLALRAHGMAPATLRRHLAILVECGLIVRRDSPNGKRFARRGQGGEIEQAFGFDLTPLVARQADFERIADEIRTERRALRRLRERLTLCRRDIVKLIALGIEEAVPGDWRAYHVRYATIAAWIPRTPTADDLQPIVNALLELADEIHNILESRANSQNASTNESQTEHHKHDSNPDLHIELEPGFRKEPGATVSDNPGAPVPVQGSSKGPIIYPLGFVLRACPDMVDYAKHGIGTWHDFVATADVVRAMLGVSPDAWKQACNVLGTLEAAIAVAAILQRAEAITSPGGYLRSLTEKAKVGRFSLGPVLMALLRAKGGKEAARSG